MQSIIKLHSIVLFVGGVLIAIVFGAIVYQQYQLQSVLTEQGSLLEELSENLEKQSTTTADVVTEVMVDASENSTQTENDDDVLATENDQVAVPASWVQYQWGNDNIAFSLPPEVKLISGNDGPNGWQYVIDDIDYESLTGDHDAGMPYVVISKLYSESLDIAHNAFTQDLAEHPQSGIISTERFTNGDISGVYITYKNVSPYYGESTVTSVVGIIEDNGQTYMLRLWEELEWEHFETVVKSTVSLK